MAKPTKIKALPATGKTGKVKQPPAPAKAKSAAKKPEVKVAKVVKASKPEKPAKPAKETNNHAAKEYVAPPPVKLLTDADLTPFVRKQKERLLVLRDGMLDSMTGVARDSLRSRAEGSEASAFGMHQADAGSDAYDRDFALSLLSQEQDALYEIDEAIKRIALGTYGICEMSGKPIPHARLEAIPFARHTVECQSQLEKHRKMNRVRQPVTSLFGLTDDEGGDGEEEESTPDTKE
jgi:RNA polymerase-binding transcription factor DksA